MAKTAQIVSVSAPKELIEWVEEAGLSASEIFQEAILNKKQIWDKMNNDKTKLLSVIQQQQEILHERNEFIEVQNLAEVYTQWRKTKTASMNTQQNNL